MKRCWCGVAVMCLGLAGPALAAGSLRIAAASNLHVAVVPLQAAFEDAHPEIRLEFSFGSSGNLVAQIRQGAPFDVFLSADLAYPQAVIASGHAAPESLITFAVGQLVLWPHPPTDDWIATLRSAEVRRIAIAQPDTAPFGMAARQALIDAKLWALAERKIIIGENVAQALHFAESGNVNYAFVAASLLVGRPRLGEGLIIPIAPAALAHGAVAIPGRENNPAAQTFLAWLGSEVAQEVLVKHGYSLP